MYGLEACPLKSADLKSLDYIVVGAFMKIFKTKSKEIARCCMETFNCPLPSVSVNNRKCIFIFIVILWGGTRSLRIPTLRPASQAGPMHNPREGNSVVLRDTIRLVCVVCSCCATSPYTEVCRAKGGIGSGETLYHDIYPARPITTVSLHGS